MVFTKIKGPIKAILGVIGIVLIMSFSVVWDAVRSLWALLRR